MDASPAVSVCIPAWNAARFLPATLASLRDQSFADWELVVVEDGTDDGTRAIVEAFGAGGPQPVTCLRHPENRGLPATRNTAIAAARAPWVALLDSDDLWLPGHLAGLLATARAGGERLGLAYAGCTLFDDASGADLGTREPTPGQAAAPALPLFSGGLVIQPSAVLLRRAAWEDVGGFDLGFRISDDRDCWLRLLRSGWEARWTGQRTCRYRKHGAALTRKVAEMAVECARIAERNAGWEALPPGLGRRLAADAWLAAGRLQWRARPAAAAEAFARAARLRPFSPTAAAGRLACAASRLLRRGGDGI